ncbi:uncharacterized protein LOC110841975 isoform X1 [Folsomia candida]|uniref:uncharacterized protein LOC110841975 isoform X1 n=1 Tax=Folsomia candida TaxID=158441 RepID=UPI000B8FFDE7|nr:uncharacterized protein LOC110841975 isoform X1 [Folsomia candida]
MTIYVFCFIRPRLRWMPVIIGALGIMASAAEILYAGALLDVAKRINDNSGPKSIIIALGTTIFLSGLIGLVMLVSSFLLIIAGIQRHMDKCKLWILLTYASFGLRVIFIIAIVITESASSVGTLEEEGNDITVSYLFIMGFQILFVFIIKRYIALIEAEDKTLLVSSTVENQV